MERLLRGFDSVYVIAGSHGLAKIGVSADPIARLAALQTGSGHHLHLAHSTLVHGDAYAAEAEAHGLLARYRQSGEWFAVPVDVAVAAVSAAAFRHSRPVELVERKPRWWLRFAVLTAIAAPVWTFSTPVPFVVVAFSVLLWAQVRLRRYRGPYSWPLALRWAGVTIGAIVASMALAMPFVARADESDFIDATNASVTTGRLHEDPDMATVGFAVVNTSKVLEKVVAVECTAIVEGDPIETNAGPVTDVAPGQTAYGTVHFFNLGGRPATASCRVSYIRTKL